LKIAFTFCAITLFASCPCFGQACVSYTLDYTGCSYNYYPSGGDTCNCALQSHASEQLKVTPGFLSERRGDKYVVAAVAAGSAADLLGIKIGDQIIAWNGLPIEDAMVGPASSWGEHSVAAIFARNGTPYKVSIPLVPMASLLDPLWLGAAPAVRHLYGPFTLGFEAEFKTGKWTVSSIFQGGPADQAGIHVGDVIVEAHSFSGDGKDAPLQVQALSSMDYQTVVQMHIRGNCLDSDVTIRAEGLSHLIRRAFVNNAGLINATTTNSSAASASSLY